MTIVRRTKDQIAALAATHIPDGSTVNLGIGLPTMIANHLPQDREILLHSENGVLGMGPQPAKGEEDLDLKNLSEEELVAWWNHWLLIAQSTNDLDADLYSHGVFVRAPSREGAQSRDAV